MELRRYEYADLYYNEADTKKVEKQRKRLERLGFELSDQDSGGEKYDYCDQYIRDGKHKQID